MEIKNLFTRKMMVREYSQKKYVGKCPNCGYLNRNLYLEETDGYMECDKCKLVSQVRRHMPRYRGLLCG